MSVYSRSEERRPITSCQTLTDRGPVLLDIMGNFVKVLQTLVGWPSHLFVTLIFLLCFKPYLLPGDRGYLLHPVVVQICLSVLAEHVWTCAWDTRVCVFMYMCMCVTEWMAF